MVRTVRHNDVMRTIFNKFGQHSTEINVAVMTAHIFISYSRKDLPFAKYFRALLEEQGLSVWMDDSLVTGMNWSAEIQKALEDCGALVVIMSPSSQESKFVQGEILHAMDRQKPIFPVLLQGTEPFFLLKSYQTEMMQAGLSATPSLKFLDTLKATVGLEQSALPTHHELEFEIVEANALAFNCDVLFLKHAGNFMGLDNHVRMRFDHSEETEPLDKKVLSQGEPLLRASEGVIGADHVLIVPTTSVHNFNYASVRSWTESSLEILLDQPNTIHKDHIAMTLHGVGIGLDETECFLAQLGGILDIFRVSPQANQIHKITIVDKRRCRISRLRGIAAAYFRERGIEWNGSTLQIETQFDSQVADAPAPAPSRPHAVVISTNDCRNDEDLFHYGIQHPVHSMGLLCERIHGICLKQNGQLEMDCERIRRATAVIVQMPPGLPNHQLFCLLGFAWGAGIPTICLSRNDQELVLEPKHYIQYSKIWELETKLSTWLLQSQKAKDREDRMAMTNASTAAPVERCDTEVDAVLVEASPI